MVARATAHDLLEKIEATGQLLAQAEATVASQVSGQLTSIAIDEGDAAAKGQILVEIDPQLRQLELEDARASLAQARAQMSEAERELSRVETLAESSVASQAKLDEMRTQVELGSSGLLAARARLGLAQRALHDASVRAPFSGLVARRLVNVGEFVAAGEALLRLVALDPIEVEFFLAEIDSSRVALGQTVEVRVASHPGEVFRGRVISFSPTIDPASRTRRVKAVIQNEDGRLLPGTFARADLGITERKGVIMVPKEAVLLRAEGQIVYRLAAGNDRVERVLVEPGRHTDALQEIRGEVAAGDWIVVRGQSKLIDGSPVVLRNEDGTVFEAALLQREQTGG